YLAVREVWDEWIAVLSTAVLSVTLWHVLFSRLGFRAVLVPLFASLSVWQVARGVRTHRLRHWGLGGAAAGALLYTYPAARAAVIPALLMILYTRRRGHREDSPSLHEGLSFAISALLVMAPFLIHAAVNPDEVLQRTGNVASVFNTDTPWAMLWDNLKGTVGMFFVRGDYLSRHNVPLRPVFDPALGAAFVVGVAVAIRRFRSDYGAAFLLFWTGTMLLPTVLAEKAPHFVRAIGVLPFLAVYPALGLAWIWRWLSRQSRALGDAIVLGVLLAGLACTTWAYFIRYPEVPDLCYRFECAGTHLASEVNVYLETGWSEGSWFAGRGAGRSDRQVFVQYQLWKDVVNAHYLIPDSPGFNVPGDPAIDSALPDPHLPMIYYGWYNRYYPDYWKEDMRRWLPPNARIELSEGPMAVTHQDKEPHPAYLKFFAEPMALPAERLADLDHGLSLVSSCTEETDTGLRVRLVWYADEVPPVDFTVFLHYERNGEIVAQADSEPGLGYYPMTSWRPGDQFVDERHLSIGGTGPGDRVYAGLYFYLTGDRVPVLSAATAVEDDRIELSLRPCVDGLVPSARSGTGS
ncbi:MAG: glycosyltransferase family 39 protein, partial [Anaerolineae bacterium]